MQLVEAEAVVPNQLSFKYLDKVELVVVNHSLRLVLERAPEEHTSLVDKMANRTLFIYHLVAPEVVMVEHLDNQL